MAAGEQRARAAEAQAQQDFQREALRETISQRDRQAQLEAYAQLAAIDRRGEVQAFLQTLDPAYAEQQEYDRNVASISRIMSDPKVAPFEKEQRIAEIMPGVKMTRQRLEQARAKHENAIAEMEFKQAQRNGLIADRLAKAGSQSLPERIQVLPNGAGFMVTTLDGKEIHIPAAKEAEQRDELGRTTKEVQAAVANAQKRVDDYIQRDRDYRARNKLPEKEWDREALLRGELQQQDQELYRRLGVSRSPGGAAIPIPKGMQGEQQPSRPQVKPFDIDAKEGLNAAQQAISEKFYTLRKAVEGSVPEEVRPAILAAADQMKAIVGANGGVPSPGSPDFERFMHLDGIVRQYLAAPLRPIPKGQRGD